MQRSEWHASVRARAAGASTAGFRPRAVSAVWATASRAAGRRCDDKTVRPYCAARRIQLRYASGTTGAYLLHHRKTDEEEDEECLDRVSCTLPEADLRLGNCKHCGAQQWNIAGDQEKGYALSQGEQGEHCVQRDGAVAATRACESGYVALQLQFATGENLRAMESLGARLITAAWDGDEKRVKDYLKDGIDVNSRDWDNLTAVVAAASAGHKKLVQLLIKEGADVNAMDKDNLTALMEV